jgi:hypothetical protein
MKSHGKSSLAEAIDPYAEAIDRCADEIVDDFAQEDLVTLATMLEQDCGPDDERSDMDLAVAAELRRRAVAGLRTWPKLTH